MLDPFQGRAAENFSDSPMSQMVRARRQASTSAMLGEIENQGYVSAAQKADEYRRRNAVRGPSVGAQIGTAVAGAAVSAGIALI